jgi:hypothetical protein
MNESDYGYFWDISRQNEGDVIYIDTGLDVQLYLTVDDLKAMIEVLE